MHEASNGTARALRLEPPETPSSGRVPIRRFRLQAGSIALEVVDAGCAIVRLEVPDRAGRPANVVLSHRDVRRYLGNGREYFGAVVGRVANRIARGRFTLRCRPIRLATNDGLHHLHGGQAGFHRRTWEVAALESAASSAQIAFVLDSRDGDEGYPGNLHARVTYRLEAAGTLRLVHEAVCDATTVVNLTNHSYFNLAGEGAGDILDHELSIAADSVCEIDAGLIPTGRLLDVTGTPFDFRRLTAIGPSLRATHPQLRCAGGFDHCYVTRGTGADTLRPVATLLHRRSGRRLQVETDRPGLQFYSGNFLDGTAVGPSGHAYGRHAGLCLETQSLPDAPNQPEFPSIELAAGERYRTETVWRFDV